MPATLPSNIIAPFVDLAEEITLPCGSVLTEQYAKASSFYLLLEGHVAFSLHLDDEGQEIKVGYSSEASTPIGWSGFNSPHRYATTVTIKSVQARLLRWDHQVLHDLLRMQADAARPFLMMMCSRARNLIREAILLLRDFAPELPFSNEAALTEEYQLIPQGNLADYVQFLRRSPFFEIFDESLLYEIAGQMQRRQYRTNDVIYRQGSYEDGIYILDSGKIGFSYRDEQQQMISFRQLKTPGFIVGWSGAINQPNLINAHAIQESVIYYIPGDTLSYLFTTHQHFATNFYFRLLWLLSHQLQAVRARLISAKFNHEIIAISNLIEQNSTQLPLTSALHKVPHLLDHKNTVADGIAILNQLKESGIALEKNIAGLTLDILEEIEKEQKFYQGLIKVYDAVVKSPAITPPEVIRSISAQQYLQLFDDIPHAISGMENLPNEPGAIFIYNHLRNHPFNTLPNQFQLTLDSHFISAMILYRNYGDPGIRIVRIGRGAEYAHQEYYQRLGYIDVYTSESDNQEQTPESREKQRQYFYQTAGNILSQKQNLIISPEGTSYGTDESPGPFKSGAFRLALSMVKEPLIVPIVLANFDQRVRQNQFNCQIKEPFYMSEKVGSPGDKAGMQQFLHALQVQYQVWVQETATIK